MCVYLRQNAPPNVPDPLIAGCTARYVSSVHSAHPPGQLRRVLDCSSNHKARLLHYFPSDTETADDTPQGHDQTAWCGWHTDHGSLTGLTSAMYVKGGVEVPNPDLDSGLYIRNRHGDVVKAAIPADHIAFQVRSSAYIDISASIVSTASDTSPSARRWERRCRSTPAVSSARHRTT